ncbi:MAG: hypothetical protein EXS18_00785 [Verrucomicrobiae bacterium]|nr:hypothetical protein [Verrucomicrobiae bacterium]
MPRTRNWLPWLWIAAVYLLLAAISWKRWVNPIVDCGREMYVPWQINEGKMLYRDLFFMYGPFVPYWHALLFKVCGTHLNVLYGVGLALVAVQAGLVFVIARRLLTTSLALLAAILFLSQFAFRPGLGNLVFPYSFNANYACTLNLIALWLVLRHSAAAATVRDRRPAQYAEETGAHRPLPQPLLWAGICVGLSLLCKQEIGIAGLAFLLIYAVVSTCHSRSAIRDCAMSLGIAVGLPLLGYGFFASQIGMRTLLLDYLWPREILGQMKFFEQHVVGTLFAPRAVLYQLGRSLTTVVALTVILCGAWAASRYVHRVAGFLWIVLITFLLIASDCADPFFRFLEHNHLYAGNLIFLLIGLIAAFRSRATPNARGSTLLWISLFALFSTWRAPLFAGISAYSSFFMAASVVVFLWVWTEWIPRLWAVIDITVWQRHATTAFTVLCLLQVGRNVAISRTQMTYALKTPRGELYAHRDIGPVLDELKTFIREKTQAGEPLLLFPEETSLYFLCDRRSPSKYYQFAPALIVNVGEEQRLIQEADDAKVRFVTVSNRATAEYGRPYFGIDYYPHIREWLLAHFHLVKTIGNPIRSLPPPPTGRFWPSEGYGIEIYERN